MKDRSSLKWILKNTKGQKANLIFVILLNVLFSLTSVAFAFAVKYIIDGATSVDKEAGKRMLIIGGAAIVSIVLLQFVLRVAVNGLTERVRAKLDMSFRSMIFDKVLKSEYKDIGEYHSGELMNRITSDVSVVTDGVTSILPTVFSAFARLVFAVVALILLDPIFAVVFTAAGLLVFIIITVMRGKLKSLHKKSQETEGKTRSFMQEVIENLLAVKVFAVDDNVEKKNDALQEDNFKIKMKRRNYAVVGHAAYNFVFSAGYVFALCYGAVKILGGALSYGSLSAILQLVNNVQVPFASLSGVMPKYYAMLASAERIIEIENVKEEVKANENFDAKKVYEKLKGIKIENLNFSYGREKVFENACFYFEKGGIVALKGSSGIGKSTLMKLLLGVYETEGNPIVLDTDDGFIKIDSSTRKIFSYVPQGNLIFSGTIFDNVVFANPTATEEEVEAALRTAEATEFVKELPKGIYTEIGENGHGLSEGQIQRIAIARAVLAKSPVILFDEATSALDEETERKLLCNIKELKNSTVIIVSHKKGAFNACDKLAEISGKTLKEVSKP